MFSPFVPPVALIGEFDVEHGALMAYASEYYAHKCDEMGDGDHEDADGCPDAGRCDKGIEYGAGSPTPYYYVCSSQQLEGVAVGRHAATGAVQPDCHAYLCHIASRVLTATSSAGGTSTPQQNCCGVPSSESKRAEEDIRSVFFHDSEDQPAVASLSFGLPDVLARGQCRQFCIAYMHTDDRLLLSQWPVLCRVTKDLITRWRERCAVRREVECSLVGQLEREGMMDGVACAGVWDGGASSTISGGCLRPLVVLLSPEQQEDDEARDRECTSGGGGERILDGFVEIHAFFDSLFPLVFSSAGRSVMGEVPPEMFWEILQHTLENRIQRASLEVVMRCVPPHEEEECDGSMRAMPSATGCECTSAAMARYYFTANPPLLAWWLARFLAVEDEGGNEGNRRGSGESVRKEKVKMLLSALFEGTQIVVTGDSSEDTASFALSMLLILPCWLRKKTGCTVHSATYRPPEASRILSFSTAFLHDSGNTFLFFPDSPSAAGSMPECREMGADVRVGGEDGPVTVVHVRIEEKSLADVTLVGPGPHNHQRFDSTLGQRITNILSQGVHGSAKVTAVWRRRSGTRPHILRDDEGGGVRGQRISRDDFCSLSASLMQSKIVLTVMEYCAVSHFIVCMTGDQTSTALTRKKEGGEEDVLLQGARCCGWPMPDRSKRSPFTMFHRFEERDRATYVYLCDAAR